MKKFIIFFCVFWAIFIVLIFMSSQCWASSSTVDSITIDTTQYPIATIEDFVNILLVNEDLYKEYFTFEEMFESYYLIGAWYNDNSVNSLTTNSRIFFMPFLQSNVYTAPRLNSTYSGKMIFTKDLTDTPIILDNNPYYYLYYYYNTSNNTATLYLLSVTDYVNNAIYIHRDFLDGYLWSNANNVYYVTNYGQPTNNRTTLVTQGQVELPQEEEEEEGLLDTLKHLFIPNEDDLTDLRSNFNTTIANKFTMSAWTFNQSDIDLDDYSYYDYSAPKWDLYFLGTKYTLDTQPLFTLLDTPIDLGYRTYRFGDYDENSNVKTNLSNGLTPRSFINLVLILNIFLLNIGLYNKFFAKGE